MNYKYGGYTQMTEAAYEDGFNREHERLYHEVVAEEPGYFYIYLSNDGTEGGEAFFDDFTILTLESYIVQQTDYYPYGLIARKFVRAGEKETKELFQSKTYEELTGWYYFHARQYDAALGRWFGVDPQNQFASPYLAMGNNPVMMVDPDGEFAFLIAAGIGALISSAAYTGNVALSSGGFNNWSWGQFGKSLAIGAVSGVVSAGIGSAFGPVGGNLAGFGNQVVHEAGRAFTHGMSNMMIGTAFGGQVSMNNFYAGAISSIAGSATHNLNGTLQVGSSALVGGISAELSGGNFWRGAAIGGTVAGLNHARHQIKLNNHVKAVRGFLKDSGFSSEMVIADVVKHKDSFWNKYYARFAGNVSDYGDFFSGGQWDSFSGTNDAYQSKVKHYKSLKCQLIIH